jgi:Phospholipase_D-nuclease N-terminal
MPRVILVLLIIGITIYSVIDCLRTDDAQIRGLPKPLWLLAIITLPPVGGLLWIWLGQQQAPGRGGQPPPRTLAPDDDPDFLRSLRQPKPKPPPAGPEV